MLILDPDLISNKQQLAPRPVIDVIPQMQKFEVIDLEEPDQDLRLGPVPVYEQNYIMKIYSEQNMNGRNEIMRFLKMYELGQNMTLKNPQYNIDDQLKRRKRHDE
ncbi:Hypothetical_protein [Hexamita inflata]|uniref:Hypothetical_protein n=1 Tax=Hexamita inflata TaxID=28002 RepID=A0AA86PJI4_9EUKA|nr:Hypothetical protein HINF_LOCUS24457 [Hexamita inflata]